MKLEIEYNYEQVALDKLEIEDISNVQLRVSNDSDLEWYISVTTDLGTTSIEEFGPLIPDLNSKENGFTYKFNFLDYAENKIASRLSKFIQDPKKIITKIENIDYDEFHNILSDAI